MPTKIEWATETWSPVTGCTKISEGCANCYAERMSKRLAGRYGYPEVDPFKVTFNPFRLHQPLKWKKPKRIFVCSMGDLFHADVHVAWIDQILNVIHECPQHIFMVLTKRPENIKHKLLSWYHNGERRTFAWADVMPGNVWLGVTAENQKRADERIPILLDIPAAVRFVSVEPMLGPVSFSHHWLGLCEKGSPCGEHGYLDWVICAPETGPGRRPYNIKWIRYLKNQCIAAGTPFFLKHLFEGKKKITTPELDGQKWTQKP